MQNAINRGESPTVTYPYAVAPGAPALIGPGLFVVSPGAVALGAQAAGETHGSFKLPKKSTDVIANGAKLYWDDTNKFLTVTATNNVYVAAATRAAVSGDTIVHARLNGVAI